jgi:hypothetical protein
LYTGIIYQAGNLCHYSAISTNNAPAKTTTGSVLLSHQQSYGFFDDINDEDWKLRQMRARSSVQNFYPDNPLRYWHKKYLPRMWYYLNYEPIFSCPNVQRIGGVGDGAKWTCDPHRLKKVAMQRKIHFNNQRSSNKNNKKKNQNSPCLIYSVGCNGLYQWEDSLLQLLGPDVCDIHVFDPGNFSRPESAVPQHGGNVYYHRWGFKSSYDEASNSLTPEENGEYLSFPETLYRLGHENRTIDILKVDCEYCEWLSYKDFIQYGDVRQLLMETHRLPLPETITKYWPFPGTNVTPNQLFDDLHAADYLLFYKEPNLFSGVRITVWTVLFML